MTIGNGVTEVPRLAFNWCTSLTTVNLGDSINVIREQAFKSCTSLSSIVLPESLRTIENEAFKNTTAMTRVVSKATTPPDFDQDPAFPYSSATLYVPQESLEAYMSHEGWQKFYQIEGVDFSNLGDVNGDGEVNIADANSVIHIIINGGGGGHGHAPGDDDGTLVGDINGDGEVNISDVNAIINLILRGKRPHFQ